MTAALARRLAKAPLTAGAALFGPHRRPAAAPRLWVLMYHRVLPTSDPRYIREEPGMVVTPATLEQQIRIARERFTLMSLQEWLDRRAQGKALPARACAITFDDGWLDNHEHALPVLERLGAPATIFVVSQMIGTSREFWPNRLEKLLGLTPESARSEWQWLMKLADREPALPATREQLAALINAAKAKPDVWLNDTLDRIEQTITSPTPEPAPSLMNWSQLARMTASGLIDVGSHTCNHLRLRADLDDVRLHHEIVASKQEIEKHLERPVQLFCYPNGDVDPRALRLVQEHYLGAVTTRRGINPAAASPHTLRRIALHEDGSASRLRFEAKLSGWL